MKNKIGTLVVLIIIYFLLKHFIPYGNYIIYPINLLVTFLHEFGHALGAIITGGDVKGVQINSDGSGVATTAGGWRTIVLMGGYIGSAILGNILLYIGFVSENIKLKKYKYSEKIIYFLAGLMVFTAIFWFESMISSLILLFMAGLFIFLALKTDFDSLILQFLGVTSLIYILEDFSVGPSSDLAKFSEIFIIIPQVVWMYIWLIIVIIITGFNLKFIFKK